LTNVARHARARSAAVALRVLDDQVELTITDDGIGIGPGTPPAGGYGLRGMRERVALQGGTLMFSSHRGVGTQVLVTAPLHRLGAATAALPGDGHEAPALDYVHSSR
jgi:signal transduction histidine kinase